MFNPLNIWDLSCLSESLMNTTGRKEVTEAVIIAALSALIGGLIGIGVEETKRVIEAYRKKDADKKKDDE